MFDETVKRLLGKYPDAGCINIGCGLDDRFTRVDNGSRIMMWFMNHIEVPIANKIMRKGDVHVYSRSDIQKLCDTSGMKMELYEVRKGFRLHCVARKPE